MFQGGGAFGSGAQNTFNSFNKPATSFGATPTAFGTATNSLFGSNPQPTTGGLFGSTNPTPAFGQPQTTTPSFGGFSNNTGTGLFGANQNASTSTGLFGATTTSAFGQAKPTFGGFGNAQTSSLFGQQPAAQPQPQTSSLFGQTAAAPSAGLFGSAGGFGMSTATPSSGTGVVKFQAVTGSDTMLKNGVSQTISTRHNCITCMKEYESKSLEELRMEDYAANRKGPQQGVQPSGGLFGSAPQPSLFGAGASTSTANQGLFGSQENKPLFGNTNTSMGFGQTNNMFGSTGGSLFGKPTAATSTFGAPTTTTTNTFAFNSGTNANPFGSNMAQVKPFGATQTTNLFGATTSQPTTGFGAQPSAFGSTFGTPSTQVNTFGTPTQTTGLFGQTQNKAAFGATSTPFSFGQTATTSAGTSLFGAKPTNTFGSPFGGTATSTTPAFGATNTGFGAPNQNTLFGNSFKPATSSFNFGPTPNTNTSLGGGSSLFGNNANKPTSLFGQTNTGTGLFGSNTFGTGSNTFGTTTNTGLGMNMPMGSMLGGSTFSTSTNNQQAANLNQSILSLTSMPFGDNPLFKKLLEKLKLKLMKKIEGSKVEIMPTGKTEELLKPAPGVAQKNLLDGHNFKVSSNHSMKIKLKPIGASTLQKVSLFEGLEEDPNLFDKMAMKPSIKRLALKAKSPEVTKLLPDVISNPLSPLENLSSEVTSPRFFTPLDSGRSSPRDKDSSVQPDSAGPSTPKLDSSGNEPTSLNTSKKSTPRQNTDGSNTVLMQTLIQSPENTMSELGNKQASSLASTSVLDNKENQEQSSSSTSSESDELGSDEPHPAGIVLRRVGYYTIPSMEDLAKLYETEGHCTVDNFTIGRYNYGNIFFPDRFNVAGINFDEIVHFRHKEVMVYPDEAKKPPLGEELNRPAQVTLDRVWPIHKTTRDLLSDPVILENMGYEETLRLACAKMSARFKEYRSQTGSWVFKVDHFSKYGLSDSDDEEPVTDIKKLRLNSAAPQTFPPALKEFGAKRGLDGAWAGPPVSTPATSLLLDQDDQDMDGDELIKTPFDLDDNYQPTQMSPTMQLATQMGASAHKVQLMKATFYTDELDDYHINGDFVDFGTGSVVDVEEFDQGPKLHKSFPLFRTHFDKYEDTPSPMPFQPVEVETESSIVSAVKIEMPQAPPMLSVRPQHKTLHCPDNGVISFNQSLSARACYAMDLSLWKGRSFRVGWGRGSTLVSLSTHNVARTVEWSLPLSQLSTVLEGRPESDHSPPIVQRISILPGHAESSDFESTIEGHLETALEHSLLSQTEEGGCPLVAPRAGVDALHAHCALAQQLALNDSHSSLITACQVWELCVALWGNLPDLEPQDLPTSHHAVMVRRQAVNDWLENVVKPELKQEMTQDTNSPGNIFSLLTGHCVLEACNQAHNAGDEYAALLLSQLSVGGVKLMLQQQLTQWVDTEADKLIDTDRLKLMMLVAGRPLLPTSERVVNLCDGLDWRRAFAVHLWYICSSVSSVTDALLRYEAAFSDDDEPYATPPQPAYLAGDLEWETSGGRVIYDVCYHLLKLFSCRAHPLAPLLNPATHSADPLDYRLSWLLLRTVEALGYSHISALSAANIHTMFATQLEAHGLWHWAVFALMHIPDTQARTKAVIDMLDRHVDLYTDPEREQFVINKLKVPAQWVYQAKATFATAHFHHKDAAEFLLKAAQWNEAHKVIIEHIAPKAIINDKYDYLGGLLRQLSSHQQVISNWGQQGAMLQDYLSIVAQVNSLVSKRDPGVGYHLERLQPQLHAVCSRINLLPTPTTIHRLCQVEIAKRALHMIRTLLMLQRGDTSQSLNLLATMTNQLPLPEDYNKQEILELIKNTVNNFAR